MIRIIKQTIRGICCRIVKIAFSYSRPENDGKILVQGYVTGLNSVDFEGNNAVLSFSDFNGNVKVGYATTFSKHNLIHGDVQIGRYCQFGPYAAINTNSHPTEYLTTYINKRLLTGAMYAHKTSKKVVIGNDVWIGKNAIILGGVTIGNGAIVAAGSVVTKDVDPYHIAAGVPARQIKKRFSDEIISELMELEWWNLDKSDIDEVSGLFHKNLNERNSIYE